MEAIVEKILDNVENVIMGKREVTKDIVKAIIVGGNVLIEDIPGIGKTTLVKALAKSIKIDYSRIQFTPDLLPSDITGISVFNQKTMEFEFRKGPIFSNLILADEINRTSPKTQAALLQVMEEKQITEDGHTYDLQEPFLVIATENPIEQEGTFSLPEALLDRFMIRVSIGYVDKQQEINILKNYKNKSPLEEIKSVVTKEDILILRKKANKVYISDELYNYIINIVWATRNNSKIKLGVSTRGAMYLTRLCQASAAIDGRDYAIPDDVKKNATLVLSHRIMIENRINKSSSTKEDIIGEIINSIKVPRVR
ncbi:MAG: AAA family ATPase [Clostridiaceae bacterium]